MTKTLPEGTESEADAQLEQACALVLWWHKGERPKTATRAAPGPAAGPAPA